MCFTIRGSIRKLKLSNWSQSIRSSASIWACTGRGRGKRSKPVFATIECSTLNLEGSRNAALVPFCHRKFLHTKPFGLQMFWNLWCEKVKFLCPDNSGTSRSETSVATSTTGSSLYLIDKRVVTLNGIRQLWCKFGPSNFQIDSSLIHKSPTQVNLNKLF